MRALGTIALALLTLAPPAAAQPGAALDSLLAPYLERYGLPALAAAVVKGGRIVASGAAGTRKAGTHLPVTVNDRFHIGSDTKAMTALLAALLVEEGKLRWDSTLGEVFPELKASMAEGAAGITLEQLLSHTSGLPKDDEAFGKLLDKAMQREDENLDEARYWLVAEGLKLPLAGKPGESWAYSNLGYTTAGAVIERAAGRPWEELITGRVFDALGLATAGLGPQADVGRIDAAVGHVLVGGKPKAVYNGPFSDNPLLIGPAGVAHMSVLDFAAWAGWNAGEGRRGPALVRPQTLKKLHAPVAAIPGDKLAKPGTPAHAASTDRKYALGWGIATLPLSPEPFLTHDGSNTKNLCRILVQPSRDLAMVMMTNIGGERAAEGLTALQQELYEKFGRPEAK